MYFFFLRSEMQLSIDVFPRLHSTSNWGLVTFGLFRISARTFISELFKDLSPTLSPTSLIRLNGMVTIMVLFEIFIDLFPYLEMMVGTPLPVFSLLKYIFLNASFLHFYYDVSWCGSVWVQFVWGSRCHTINSTSEWIMQKNESVIWKIE